MPGRLKFLASYFLFWVLFFQCARLVFILYHFSKASELPFSTMALSFWHGLKMDISMASYLLVPVSFFVIASVFVPFFQKTIIYRVYTFFVLFFVLFIITADLEVYQSWGFRIDSTPLRYFSSPNEVWASISHLPVFLFLFIFLLVWAGLCFVAAKLIKVTISLLQRPAKKIAVALLLLLFTATLIIPIRGGLQQTPMTQGSVYFSKHHFANISAINATWNFMKIVLKNRSVKNPYKLLDPSRAMAIADSMYHSDYSDTSLLKVKNPNVILIIWESFTEKAIHENVNGTEVTPHFNNLKKEGIYFSRMYATGDRTDKGLAAILSGYPSMNNFSILSMPEKGSRLKTMGSLFKEKNYYNTFYYGGELEFANIKSYVLQGGYDEITGKDDFAKKDRNSKWGAHDGVVAEKILVDAASFQQPFFTTWLTLSSHEPFETPVDPVFNGNTITTEFMNSLHYTDEVISRFVSECKQQPWWNNTLIVIIADHGHGLIEPYDPLFNFKIPMLWLGGALKTSGIEINKICSQLDLANTLSHQLGQDHYFSYFSRNIFDSTSREWAYFSFNDGFGLVQPAGSIVYDNVGNRLIAREGDVGEKDILAGRALQQVHYEDFLEK